MMRKRSLFRLLAVANAVIALALALGARAIHSATEWSFLSVVETYSMNLSLVLFLCIAFELCACNKLYKGFKYFWYYSTVKNTLEKQLIDAGFFIQRSYYVEIPKIYLSFDKSFSTGILRIRNKIKFDKKLDDVVLSSALKRFVVERHWITDDGNFYIFELVDGSASFKITFNSFDEFIKYSDRVNDYKLFFDKRTDVKLQHTLLVGLTGSGKTYALYNLLLQMICKKTKYELYFSDPKGSSLAVLGQLINSSRTAVDVQDIIRLLEEFVYLMRERKAELKEKLKTKIDADYSTFNLSPYVYICDEYAAFVSVLANEDKKTRDKVKALLYEVILQGRQLGFFLFLVMQKSDATLIDTALRDNIPCKIVLGNSEQQTYVTAFGTGTKIPQRHYLVGEGVFTEPTLAPEPKLVQFPLLNFDILSSCEKGRGVM